MVVQHGVGQTQATLGAVEKVAPPTDPTKATPIAVELTLVRIVIETTGLTKIIAKLETTFRTSVCDLQHCKDRIRWNDIIDLPPRPIPRLSMLHDNLSVCNTENCTRI